MTEIQHSQTSGVTRLADQFDAVDMTEPQPYSLLHADADITLILYRPQEEDLQTPHEQDEYYFVASGSGGIQLQDGVHTLSVGDAVYVAALEPHKFIDVSADFSCWALFYGRKSTGSNRASISTEGS